MYKILKDEQVRDGKTLNDKMAHFKIENNNLVITMDFDHASIAAWQYYQMIGVSFEEIQKGDLIKKLVLQ